MKRYSESHKKAVIAKMMPPHNLSVSALAEETGITYQTLYNLAATRERTGVNSAG